jgi:Domain of unknown function (DUF397)
MNESASGVDRASLLWRRSRACNPAECVEVALSEHLILVRDSKDRSGPVLEFSPQAWRDFLAEVARGRHEP